MILSCKLIIIKHVITNNMKSTLILTSQGFVSEKAKVALADESAKRNSKSAALITNASSGGHENKFNIKDRETLLQMGYEKCRFH